MLWGDRTLIHDESYVFEDEKNGFKAIILFNQKKHDRFVGKLYHYKPELHLQKKEVSKLSDIKDIQQDIAGIHGSWLESLTIGDEEYWRMDEIKPYKSIPVANPLPSDPRYREDVLWVRRENEHNAQIWKNYLE
jgi:hypothetical protein